MLYDDMTEERTCGVAQRTSHSYVFEVDGHT